MDDSLLRYIANLFVTILLSGWCIAAAASEPESMSRDDVFALLPLDPADDLYDRVADAARSGEANFAVEWQVVEISCGTACQQVFLVHLKSGRVLHGPVASAGTDFSADETWLVINPPAAIYEAYGKETPDWLHTRYYIFDTENESLIQLEKKEGVRVVP